MSKLDNIEKIKSKALANGDFKCGEFTLISNELEYACRLKYCIRKKDNK